MRIRKVSQPTPIIPDTAQITDTYSTSAEDGYSCNYVNNNFAEKSTPTIDGSISKTGRKINGKDEYIYYGTIDSLPNASNATYATPVLMSDIEFVTGFGGTAYRESNESWFQFNCFRQSFSDGIGIQGTTINGYMGFYVQTGNDRRALKGYPWFTFTYKDN